VLGALTGLVRLRQHHYAGQNGLFRPARTIFFRSISSPIMNSIKIRPSSEMMPIDSCGLTYPMPNGPMKNPATR
jgi:hypothetical protein